MREEESNEENREAEEEMREEESEVANPEASIGGASLDPCPSEPSHSSEFLLRPLIGQIAP